MSHGLGALGLSQGAFWGRSFCSLICGLGAEKISQKRADSLKNERVTQQSSELILCVCARVFIFQSRSRCWPGLNSKWGLQHLRNGIWLWEVAMLGLGGTGRASPCQDHPMVTQHHGAELPNLAGEPPNLGSQLGLGC